MASKGWICLHRQLQDCWVWEDKPFARGQAWVDILLSCNHRDKNTSFDGRPCVVTKGEWITSIMVLTERWGWGRKKVSNFLDVLEKDGMISQKRDNRKTLIKVLNYEVYQDDELSVGTSEEHQRNSRGTAEEQQRNSRGTAEEHQRNTNNNVNNENNIKEKDISKDISKKKVTKTFVKPTTEEVKAYCLERNNGINPESFVNHYESNGWMVGKTKMKDWKASVRTWETNDRRYGTKGGGDSGNARHDARENETNFLARFGDVKI